MKFNVFKLQQEIDRLYLEKDSTKKSLEGQGRGITMGIIKGQQEKLESEYNVKIQEKERQKNFLLIIYPIFISLIGVLTTVFIQFFISTDR